MQHPKKFGIPLQILKTYSNWSRFLTKLEGEVKERNRIKVLVDDMKFKPKVLVFSKSKEFKWKGKLLFPGIFDGTNQFLFIDNGDGTTTFEQNEFFKGILVPLFKKKLNTEIKSKFEQMNSALKKK